MKLKQFHHEDLARMALHDGGISGLDPSFPWLDIAGKKSQYRVAGLRLKSGDRFF